MKRRILVIGLMVWILGSAAAWAEEVPREIAGYRLGDNIKASSEQEIAVGPIYPVRLRPYLMEMPVVAPEGFLSAYVTYGNCHAPGMIVKIKVKYAYGSRRFFNRLLKAFKRRFGEPSEYVGDVFQAYVAWKWRFRDAKGDRFNMVLSHYSGPEEEYTRGNVLKLTYVSQIEREWRCYEEEQKRQADVHPSRSRKKRGRHGEPKNLDPFIPRF